METEIVLPRICSIDFIPCNDFLFFRVYWFIFPTKQLAEEMLLHQLASIEASSQAPVEADATGSQAANSATSTHLALESLVRK